MHTFVPAAPHSPEASLSPADTPSIGGVVRAVASLVAFGACAGLGAAHASTVATFAALPVASIVGAAALTGPGLIAGYLLLDRDARIDTPVAALAQALVAAGTVGLGLAPIALFLVATTGLWAAIAALGLFAIGLAAATAAVRVLLGAGARAWFVAGWFLVAALVSLRLAWATASIAGGAW
jgi:hypothetical protein